MKIALCKSSFAGPISGADETLVTYATKLHHAGHDVTVVLLFPFAPEDPFYARLREAGVPVSVIADRAFLFSVLLLARQLFTHLMFVFFLVSNFPNEMRRAWQLALRYLSLLYYARCRAYFRERRADVMHVVTPDTGTTMMIRAGRAAGIPVLYQELGTPDHRPGLAGYYRRLARVTPLCVEIRALSPFLSRQWSGHLPHRGRIGVLPLIVDRPNDWRIPRRDVPFSVSFGFAARMEEGKGPSVLLDAFASLRKEFAGAYLRLAGFGPQVFELRARSRRLGVYENCDFVSFYTDPRGGAAFMQSLDVFVLPSLAEGTPNSIIEAMACGVPVIASAVGGIPDVLTPETGILVPPGDSEALARAMLRLAADAELRVRMGRAARKRYEEVFSPEAVLPVLERAYERASGQARDDDPLATARPVSAPAHPWEACEADASYFIPARRRSYHDRDITFYLQGYRDIPLAQLCLRQIRRHYKQSRVILISDGDDDPRWKALARRFRADYVAGERLYTVENGGRMIQRMLDAYLREPSEYLFKVDTDTRVHRRFRYLPVGRAVFGTLEWATADSKTRLDFPNVQGGCMGFTLEAAREIAESGRLLSGELLDYKSTYADNPDILSRAEVDGLISADFLTRYVCRKLEIPLAQFDEVYSVYRSGVGHTGEGYAVTHPHKSLAGGTRLARLRGPLSLIAERAAGLSD